MRCLLRTSTTLCSFSIDRKRRDWLSADITPIFDVGLATGNRKADRLAEEARDKSKDEHSYRQIARRRARVSELISRFLHDMEDVFKTAQDIESLDGPSADDFVIDASQEIPSASSDT